MADISPEDQAKAAEALAAAWASDDAPVAEQAEPVAPAPEEATPEAPAAPEAPEAPEAPAAEEDSFIPRADLQSLLDGVEDPDVRERIERAYKSFQSGYTRKTQEIAREREKLSGLDPELAQQAVEFVTALQTDGDFALQVHEELTKSLEQAGLTRRQAEVEATRQIEETTLDPELEALGVDPDNPLVRKLNELENWKREQEANAQRWQQEQEQERQVNEALALIERQTLDIRKADPTLSDEDMDAIYKIAASTGGNLFEAESYFKDMRDRFVSAYVSQKAAVPAGVTAPPPSAPAEEPVVIADTDEGHKLAQEKLRQILAQG